jgi:hypothetical protein
MSLPGGMTFMPEDRTLKKALVKLFNEGPGCSAGLCGAWEMVWGGSAGSVWFSLSGHGGPNVKNLSTGEI